MLGTLGKDGTDDDGKKLINWEINFSPSFINWYSGGAREGNLRNLHHRKVFSFTYKLAASGNDTLILLLLVEKSFWLAGRWVGWFYWETSFPSGLNANGLFSMLLTVGCIWRLRGNIDTCFAFWTPNHPSGKLKSPTLRGLCWQKTKSRRIWKPCIRGNNMWWYDTCGIGEYLLCLPLPPPIVTS